MEKSLERCTTASSGSSPAGSCPRQVRVTLPLLDAVAWLSVVNTAGYTPKRPTIQGKPDATDAELNLKPSTAPNMNSP
jgi:hypothetical protein